MKNLRITGRLFAGFGLMVALLLGLALVSIVTGNDVASAGKVQQRALVMASQLKDTVMVARNFRALVWAYEATKDEAIIAQRNAASDDFRESFEHLDALATGEGKRLLSDYHRQFLEFESLAVKMNDLRRQTPDTAVRDYAERGVAVGLAAKRVTETAHAAISFYEGEAERAIHAADSAIGLAQILSLAAAAFATLVGGGMAILTARGIVNPIRAITGAMSALSLGNLKIAVPALERRDEVGDMAKALQIFKDNMIEAERLRAEAAKAQAEKERRARTVEELTRSFESNVGLMVGVLSSAATEMEATAQSMSSTADQTNQQSLVVASAAEQASANVQAVAGAADQLSASIAEIGRQVAQSADMADQAVRNARRTDSIVQSLADGARNIGGVVTLIQGIAAQTRLLALNATIEAARAGAAGKGFAVVATEVKALAEQAAKATDQISEHVEGMRNAAGDAVAAIQDISGAVNELNQASSAIAGAVEQQSAATLEIARNVQQAASGTTEVSANIVGVQQAANDTGAAASQVLTAAGGLAEQSNRLSSEVRQYIAGINAA